MYSNKLLARMVHTTLASSEAWSVLLQSSSHPDVFTSIRSQSARPNGQGVDQPMRCLPAPLTGSADSPCDRVARRRSLGAAATFVDLSSGGHITLSLSDGSELARHVPPGQTELTALFDAMR